MTDYADFTLLQTGQQVQDILNRGQYAVTYSSDSAYVLDSEQKAQARTNIGAASAADLSNLSALYANLEQRVSALESQGVEV